MVIFIRDFSIYSAFQRLEEEIKIQNIAGDSPEYLKEFINADKYGKLDDIEQFEGTGVIYGQTESVPSANKNQTRSSVHDYVVKGDKRWKSKYMGLFDDPDGSTGKILVPNSISDTKKGCVDACRAATEETCRSTFAIIGKILVDSSKIQSAIVYKPSPKQEYGTFKFVW